MYFVREFVILTAGLILAWEVSSRTISCGNCECNGPYMRCEDSVGLDLEDIPKHQRYPIQILILERTHFVTLTKLHLYSSLLVVKLKENWFLDCSSLSSIPNSIQVIKDFACSVSTDVFASDTLNEDTTTGSTMNGLFLRSTRKSSESDVLSSENEYSTIYSTLENDNDNVATIALETIFKPENISHSFYSSILTTKNESYVTASGELNENVSYAVNITDLLGNVTILKELITTHKFTTPETIFEEVLVEMRTFSSLNYELTSSAYDILFDGSADYYFFYQQEYFIIMIIIVIVLFILLLASVLFICYIKLKCCKKMFSSRKKERRSRYSVAHRPVYRFADVVESEL